MTKKKKKKINPNHKTAASTINKEDPWIRNINNHHHKQFLFKTAEACYLFKQTHVSSIIDDQAIIQSVIPSSSEINYEWIHRLPV